MAQKKAKKAAPAAAASVAVMEKKAAVKSEAPAKKAPAKAKITDAAVPKAYVIIDHPSEGETVSGLHYAIRIGASDGETVEISFDGDEWQPCRSSAGYWWFDWGYFTQGSHKIEARLRNGDKTVKKSPVRKVTVI